METRNDGLDDPIGNVANSLLEIFGDRSIIVATSQYDAAEGQSRITWAKIIARLETPEGRRSK